MSLQKICAHAALSLALVSSATSHGMNFFPKPSKNAALISGAVVASFAVGAGVTYYINHATTNAAQTELKRTNATLQKMRDDYSAQFAVFEGIKKVLGYNKPNGTILDCFRIIMQKSESHCDACGSLQGLAELCGKRDCKTQTDVHIKTE